MNEQVENGATAAYFAAVGAFVRGRILGRSAVTLAQVDGHGDRDLAAQQVRVKKEITNLKLVR